MKNNYLKFLLTFLCLVLMQATYSQNKLAKSKYATQVLESLAQNKNGKQLSTNDLDDVYVQREFLTKKSGVKHMYLTQRYRGIEIYNATANMSIKNGKVFYHTNNFVNNVSRKANATVPLLSAKDAISKVRLHFKLNALTNLELIEKTNSKEYLFNKGGVSQENIPVKLVFLPENDQLKLAWDLSVLTKDGKHWWSVRVDALTGKILNSNDWIISCSFEGNQINHGTSKKSPLSNNQSFNLFKTNNSILNDGSQYNVLPLPAETPDDGSIQLISEPASILASPHGWHDDDDAAGAEYTTTQGNNVIANEDANGNNGTGYMPDGGAGLNFNFLVNFNTQQPADYQDAAITNLFYMNNMMHDIWYHYGFDENAGNFQENNYRRGNAAGAGDPVDADAQDGSGTNNANFGTPPDGFSPRMQMFLWDELSSPPIAINNGSLAGVYNGTPAGFGPDFPDEFPITADVVLVLDDDSGGTSSDPNDACDVITNGSALSGKIAILRRGDCEFGFKVLAAETEGAIAVIVVNNIGNTVTSLMGAGAVGAGVTIPSVMIGLDDGEAIITELNGANTVNVTLASEEDLRDGDFSNIIVAHEYGHGISNRLTGGAPNVNCLDNSEQMGEGWSDWFGLMITMKTGDLQETPRTMFNYITPNGTDFSRRSPYSTDFAVNNYTYGATNDNTNFGTAENPFILNEGAHYIGFVWATVLWDLSWAYVDKYGFDADLYNGTGGNNKVMQIVMDGLKLQPCSPGYVDGRDAILAADMALTGGEDQCLIWEAFATRGLGINASQGFPNSMIDQVESFVIPTEADLVAPFTLANCTTLSSQGFDKEDYKIYPNPSNNKLFIKVSRNYGEVNLTLTDINGRQVLSKKVDLFGEVSLDINRFQSGIYILNIKGLDINVNEKIIKN